MWLLTSLIPAIAPGSPHDYKLLYKWARGQMNEYQPAAKDTENGMDSCCLDIVDRSGKFVRDSLTTQSTMTLRYSNKIRKRERRGEGE